MAVLEKRSLGKMGMKATALGLGCAHLGNPNKGTDEEAIEAVRHAIDLGINFVAKGVVHDAEDGDVGFVDFDKSNVFVIGSPPVAVTAAHFFLGNEFGLAIGFSCALCATCDLKGFASYCRDDVELGISDS